ncbi:hypothetical protein TRICI_002276 [Trichomonascus ciferrii]|uniref:Uncharacterized protein n=1 Tax=Trichomonascus ciferrii TaxID=44093 RepID=A0A642V704_9ASCO|nr:hypothetical protein TRICI_002276 [Trichomonascus ciferrii]
MIAAFLRDDDWIVGCDGVQHLAPHWKRQGSVLHADPHTLFVNDDESYYSIEGDRAYNRVYMDLPHDPESRVMDIAAELSHIQFATCKNTVRYLIVNGLDRSTINETRDSLGFENALLTFDANIQRGCYKVMDSYQQAMIAVISWYLDETFNRHHIYPTSKRLTNQLYEIKSKGLCKAPATSFSPIGTSCNRIVIEPGCSLMGSDAFNDISWWIQNTDSTNLCITLDLTTFDGQLAFKLCTYTRTNNTPTFQQGVCILQDKTIKINSQGKQPLNWRNPEISIPHNLVCQNKTCSRTDPFVLNESDFLSIWSLFSQSINDQL